MAAVVDTHAALRPDSRADTLYAAETRSLSPREALRLIVKTWPLITAQRRLLALKCILAFTSLGFFLLTPWPMKIIIDNVIDGHPLAGLPRALLRPIAGDDRFAMLTIVTGFLLVAVLLVGMAGDQPQELSASVDSGGMDQAGFTANDANEGWSLWNGLFGLVEVWITLDLTQRLNQIVRTAVYERFLRSPLKLYTDQKIGDAVFRVMHDTAAIAAILYRGILAPLLSIVMFGVTMVIITAQFHHQPLIPILAALSLPAVAIGTALFNRPLRDQSQRMRARGSEVMAAFEERIAQVHLIKAFGQEERERAAVDAASWSSFRAALKMLAIGLTATLVVTPLVGTLILFGTYKLMIQVIAGKLTLGDVTLLGAYAYMLGRPMSTIGSTWAEIQGPIAGLRRMHSVLDRLGESEPDGTAREITEPIRELQLRGLSVAYDPAAPVLANVTMTLRAGELAALAGSSGCGKSTLIHSIPRFIEPVAGAVLLDGVDARQFPAAAIRARIAFVFQHEALFSATIAENIRYGSSSATVAEVERAAAMAGADEFIRRLPDGYATMLGRRGTRLSAGQKQRIAVARALLRNPYVLILDEPTAPLDPDSEKDLMRTLRELAADRIVLIVAHRPETLERCDFVHFLHAGTLAASGSHRALLDSCPPYRIYLAAAPGGGS